MTHNHRTRSLSYPAHFSRLTKMLNFYFSDYLITVGLTIVFFFLLDNVYLTSPISCRTNFMYVVGFILVVVSWFVVKHVSLDNIPTEVLSDMMAVAVFGSMIASFVLWVLYLMMHHYNWWKEREAEAAAEAKRRATAKEFAAKADEIACRANSDAKKAQAKSEACVAYAIVEAAKRRRLGEDCNNRNTSWFSTYLHSFNRTQGA